MLNDDNNPNAGNNPNVSDNTNTGNNTNAGNNGGDDTVSIFESESEAYYKKAMIGDYDLVNNPHDKYFKTSIRDRAITHNVVKLVLPPNLASRIVWSDMKPVDTSFIIGHLDEKQCDALIELGYINKTDPGNTDSTKTESSAKTESSDKTSSEGTCGLIEPCDKVRVYFLAEHKSYPDPEAIFKIYSYKGVIWTINVSLLRKEGKPIKLVPIIPILFVHGDKQIEYVRNFNELFGNMDSLLKESVMGFPIYTVNTKYLNDDDFNACFRFKLFMMMMKYIFHPTDVLLDIFEDILSSVSPEVRSANEWFIYFSANYVMGAKRDFDKSGFYDGIKQKMTKEVFVNAANKLVEKGRTEGRREMGIKVAKMMKSDGKDIDEIIDMTGLSLDDIKSL